MTLPTTQLGQTGLTVSRLVLGTMTFGLQTDDDTSRQILDAAADSGINFLDTADVYPLGGGLATAGRTEEIIGRWLKGKRDRFILATKCVGRVGESPWDQGASRKLAISRDRARTITAGTRRRTRRDSLQSVSRGIIDG